MGQFEQGEPSEVSEHLRELSEDQLEVIIACLRELLPPGNG